MDSDSDEGFVDVEELTKITKTINEVKYIIHYTAQFDSACRSDDYALRFVSEVSKLMDDTCPPKLLWALLLHFIQRPLAKPISCTRFDGLWRTEKSGPESERAY